MGRILDVVTLSDDDADDGDPPPTPPGDTPLQPVATWVTIFNTFYKVRLAEAQQHDPDTDMLSLFEAVSEEWTTMSIEDRQMFAKNACGASLPIPPSHAQTHNSPTASSAAPAQTDLNGTVSDLTPTTSRAEKSSEQSLTSKLQPVSAVAPHEKRAKSRPSGHTEQDAPVNTHTPADERQSDLTPQDKKTEEHTAVPQPAKNKHKKKSGTNKDLPAKEKVPVEEVASKVDKDKKIHSKNKEKQKDGKAADHHNDVQARHSKKKEEERAPKTNPSGSTKTSNATDTRKENGVIDRSDCDTTKVKAKKSSHPASMPIRRKDTNGGTAKSGASPAAPPEEMSEEMSEELCLGPGCTNRPVDNPYWDKEYCSFRCCSDYVNLSFKKWVRERKKELRDAAKAAAADIVTKAQRH